jgi:two-component system, cell cycle response regulator
VFSYSREAVDLGLPPGSHLALGLVLGTGEDMSAANPSTPPQSPRGTIPTLLDDDTARREAPSSKRPRNRGLLTRTGGVDAGRVYAVRAGESSIGRAAGCTIEVNDASLSRVHARIFAAAGEYVLQDAGSLNGCYINEERVEQAMLRDGDRVQLGSSVTLRFHLVDEEEQQALVRVYESSVRDGLTGVFNRRHLEERLAAELAYSVRHKTPFSLAMFDIDRFKSINDTHGHAAGDTVLKATAALLGASVRTEDMVARYGGEEFVVLARGVPLAGAIQFAERIRLGLEQAVIPIDSGQVRVTTSVGVASLACCGAKVDNSALLAIADARLYLAKQAGRNRVVGEG